MAGENIGGLQITIISPIKDKENTDREILDVFS